MAMLNFFEKNRSVLENVAAKTLHSQGLRKPYFLAEITSSSPVRTNVYKYSWHEVIINGTATEATKSGGISSDDDGMSQAYNLCELNNTSETVAPGVAVGSEDYPDGYSMRPVGSDASGTSSGPIVVMFQVREGSATEGEATDVGKLHFVFCLANAHDGACE